MRTQGDTIHILRELLRESVYVYSGITQGVIQQCQGHAICS